MAMTHEQFETWMENQRQHQAAMIATLASTKKKTPVDCAARFGGNRDSVESFLSALKIFKQLETLSDSDVITGLPLLLTDDASDWWEGIKDSVTTYAEFQVKIRQKYSPKQPAYLLYNDIYSTKQKANETTENFVAKKRLLFSKLPAPKHPEIQQIDMIYMLLRLEIRDKIPRNDIITFDDLTESARGVKKVLEERVETEIPTPPTSSEPQVTEPTEVRCMLKLKCGFCKIIGHSSEVCRKRIKAEKSENFNQEPTPSKEQAPPITSAPKLSCYGCGAPGVVRTNCSNCAGKTLHKIKTENISFCALNVRACVQARPVLFIEIGGENGQAYVDTCAKASIASYSLYQKLVEKGYTFKKEQVNLSLADGITKIQTVLVVQVAVRLNGRAIPTTFLVLPESRNNKTLLGIGFLQKAGLTLDLAQFTWRFFAKLDEKRPRTQLKGFINSEQAATPISIASMGNSIQNEPLAVEPQSTASYPKLRRLDIGTVSKQDTIFDGYSPRLDYMFRDAQMNMHLQEEDLSPQTRLLFPDTRYIDIDINSLDISLPSNEILDPDCRCDADNGQPAKDVEHRIDTGTKGPIAVLLRQADQSKPYVIKTDASGYALRAVLIQGEGDEEHPEEYASRQLTPAESKYSTTEREALAVVWAVNEFGRGTTNRHCDGPFISNNTKLPLPTQPLRRRGRPRKEQLPLIPKKPSKRGRGRPRKNH